MSVLEPNHYWDGIMNGVDPGEEEFANILDILDFPVESLEEDDGLGGDLDPSNYQNMGPIPVDALSGVSPGFSIGSSDANRVPCYKAPINIGSGRQELPNYVADDTSTITLCQNLISPESSAFQMPSPVSVLESSYSSGKSLSILADRPVRARSKRARKSTVNPWLLLSPITYASVSKKRSSTGKGKDKKKRKLNQLPNSLEASENFSLQAKKKLQAQLDAMEKKETSLQRSVVTKKCMHCEVTKTPQWREGPLGPKTLCNACGVRYRSGRLFPEYRPAASPTFVPSLHSNSHKKVIAMRKNTMQQAAATEDDPPMSPLPELIPTSSHLLEYLF